MVDTTHTIGSISSPQPIVAAAGAPDVTPAMIEAGERAIFAFGMTPNLSTGGWASDLAIEVYRAMERSR